MTGFAGLSSCMTAVPIALRRINWSDYVFYETFVVVSLTQLSHERTFGALKSLPKERQSLKKPEEPYLLERLLSGHL